MHVNKHIIHMDPMGKRSTEKTVSFSDLTAASVGNISTSFESRVFEIRRKTRPKKMAF